jgi:predicted kinase
MYQDIERELKLRKTVIHDTGNFTKNERTLVKNIADKLGVESTTIFVSIPVDIAKQRLIKNRLNPIRFDVTDNDFENTIKELEIPNNSEKHFVFNYNENINNWIDKYFK